MGGFLGDCLVELLAVLLMGGCTVSMSSIGIGPLVFMIMAIVSLVSKSLRGRAKLWNTVLTASILGAIVHIVLASAMSSLAQQISDTNVLCRMAAGQNLASSLICAFVACRSQYHVVPTALAAVVATYVALGWEGLLYVLEQNATLNKYGVATFLLSSVPRVIAAGLGAVLFSLLVSFLAGRHHRE